MMLIQHIISCILINALLVIAGFIIIKQKRIYLAWISLPASISIVIWLVHSEQPLVRMLAIIATTFTAMKIVAVTETHRSRDLALTFRQWLAFAIGWVGMRAEPFQQLGRPTLPGVRQLLSFGISRICAGILLVLLARYVATHYNLTNTYLLVTSFLLVGFSLILHFGLLSISAGIWRLKGVPAYSLFRQPAKALSLTELWSKRWNIAFSEMTSITVYRPLRKHIGPVGALLSSFFFSGLLHEAALTLPVCSGYGMPTLYFVIQGLMVIIERAMKGRDIGRIFENNIIARAWVYFWLIAPMPLLFTPAFVQKVLFPMASLRF